MIPPGQLNGAPYGLRVKNETHENGDLVVAIAVMAQALQNTFTRRAVTLNSSQSAAERMVAIERATNSMVQSLQITSAKEKAKTRSVASVSVDRATILIYMLKLAITMAGVAGTMELIDMLVGRQSRSVMLRTTSVALISIALVMIGALVVESNSVNLE